MTYAMDDIVENAHHGTGPCRGCPAHADTHGQFVNPGLINPAAEVMFLTMDPSHRTDWSRHDSWDDYNHHTASKFINQ